MWGGALRLLLGCRPNPPGATPRTPFLFEKVRELRPGASRPFPT